MEKTVEPPTPEPVAYKMPRSRSWARLRDAALKPLLKGILGRRLYHDLTEKYYWAVVFVNYVFMRVPFLRRRYKVGLWSQSLYIEGTNACNAACVFCAYPQMERPKALMPMDVFRESIDQWTKLGGDEIDLTPIVGEPLADKLLFERMDYMLSTPKIRRFHFFSNAVLIKPEHCEKLCKYSEKLIVYLSFGGFDRETYHKIMGIDKHAEAVAAIRCLIETKRRMASRLVIQINLRTPEKNGEHGEFWEYLQKSQDEKLIVVDKIAAYDSWAGSIGDKELAESGLTVKPMPSKRGPCHRLMTTPMVLTDGRVNGCADRDIETVLIVGDMKKQPLGEILKGDALFDLIDAHDRGEPPEVCRRCNYWDSLYPNWLQGPLFKPVNAFFNWLNRR